MERGEAGSTVASGPDDGSLAKALDANPVLLVHIGHEGAERGALDHDRLAGLGPARKIAVVGLGPDRTVLERHDPAAVGAACDGLDRAFAPLAAPFFPFLFAPSEDPETGQPPPTRSD